MDDVRCRGASVGDHDACSSFMSARDGTAVRVNSEIAVDSADIVGPVCSRGVGDIEIVGEVAIPAGDEFLRLWRSLGDVGKDGGPRLNLAE